MHAKKAKDNSRWIVEKLDINLYATQMLLVRVRVGKIENLKKVLRTLMNVPTRESTQGWTCKSWVKEALETLDAAPERTRREAVQQTTFEDVVVGSVLDEVGEGVLALDEAGPDHLHIAERAEGGRGIAALGCSTRCSTQFSRGTTMARPCRTSPRC